MKSIIKLAVPSVLAFAALGVNAQTIETDYPRVVPAGPVVATVAPVIPVAGTSVYSENAPYLIQSNAEGPRVNPMYAASTERTLARVENDTQLQAHVQWNAPDLRS